MVMTNDSDRDWEQFGTTDPYYAVLTDERYQKDRLTVEDRAAFFQSGEEHVERILSIVRKHLAPDFAPRRALDFGCGVGRVLVPLAKHCPDVTGVDISSSMLAEARDNCDRAGVPGVELLLADDALSRVTRTYDFIHSYIVLQHIPTYRGERIVRELLSRLASGGIAMFHITYAHATPPLSKLLYWSRTRVPGAHALLNVLLGRPHDTPMMQGNDYSVTRLLDIMNELGCGDVHVRFSDHQGHRGVLLFCQRAPVPAFA